MNRLIIISILILLFVSCEQSDGTKFGLLQKVSHKTFPCDYYEIQIAFEGGVVQTNSKGENSGYSNVQDFKISKEMADTLSSHIGDKVVVKYKDGGYAVCGESKEITSIRLK